MSLWQRYNTLTSRTRLLLGLGVMGYATVALYLTDTAEKALGYEASEEEKRRLRGSLPRVTMVERGEARGRGRDGGAKEEEEGASG